MARHLFYMGLEAYQERYSWQLTAWNEAAFAAWGLKRNDYTVVEGLNIRPGHDIKVGAVLDSDRRTFWSLTQNAELVRMLATMPDQDCADSVILYEDMFTPGLEALAYINSLSPQRRPKVFVRCLAQTIDPDDFVHRCGMFDWMRHYELMLDQFVDGILVASEEMVSFLRVAGFKAKIYTTGLPFWKPEVQARFPSPPALRQRPQVISFASRFDSEKQPWFIYEVARSLFERHGPHIEFRILTGASALRSDVPEWISAMKRLPNVHIYEGLSKDDYYRHLTHTRVLLNTSLQDWVSNTVSEADALGCLCMFPAYRSFPEVFDNNAQQMYIPWSVEDCVQKLEKRIRTPELYEADIGSVSDWTSKTIFRTLDVVFNNNDAQEREGRNGPDYRKHIAKGRA